MENVVNDTNKIIPNRYFSVESDKILKKNDGEKELNRIENSHLAQNSKNIITIDD